jgi:hypothetical protein
VLRTAQHRPLLSVLACWCLRQTHQQGQMAMVDQGEIIPNWTLFCFYQDRYHKFAAEASRLVIAMRCLLYEIWVVAT